MSMAVDVVRRFCDLRVLAIGDAILDSYLEGSASRLCREGPVPVVRKTSEKHVPGGAANTAANLKALGAEVIFIGIVGQDAPGRSLRAALRAQGVDDRWLVEDPATSTLHKLRILARSQYVVRFDEGETRSCSSEGQQRLVANLERAFPLCDLVVMSDYGYGVASEEVIGRLRELRAARPCVLVVDAKDLRRFRHAGATVVTPNQLEALLAVEPGSHYDGAIDIVETERIGQRLLATIDAEYAAITMAGDGVLLVDRHEGALHLPARPVAHANDVGAGDSFTAAFALALGAGASCEEAARIGTEAATIAVAKQRTAVVHHQELLQQVSLHDYDTALEAGDAAVEALAAQLDTERRSLDGQARTIVFTNGVFDILHAGHIHFLRAAKALGDVLVVGVNSDRSARQLKGKNRPINGERDRLALVAALDPVDHAILFDEETPAALIRALRPDIHVKGGDYAGQELPEAEAVREVGGRIEILPPVGSQSTTGMIDRILTLATPSRAAAPKHEGSRGIGGAR